MPTIEQLNIDFGITDKLRLVTGAGGFTMIEISNAHATALISTYSGHVLAYQPNDEAEPLLFLSEQTVYQQGIAIRGGVPICWPWFGQGNMPAHGFVRNRQWQLIATELQQDGSIKVTLEICDDEQSQKIWPHKFKLQLEVIIGATLTMTLTTFNLDNDVFTISEGFHTYLTVGDIEKVAITGVDDATYLDKTSGFSKHQQQGDLRIKGEVDRIYLDLQHNVVLTDQVLNRQIVMSCSGAATAVIWSPGEEVSMDDLADDAYKQFICIEAVNTEDDNITVAAGDSHHLTVDYAIKH